MFGPNLVPRVSLGAKLTQVLSLLLWLFSIFTTFCCGSHKLLPWRSKTFAMAFTNFCLGFHKLLPWHSQTFAVKFTNFCCGVRILLPWHSQRFALAFTNFCCSIYKFLLWHSNLWSGYQIFTLVGLKISLPTLNLRQ